MPLKVHDSWRELIAPELSKPYFLALKKFLTEEIQSGRGFFPKPEHMFASFDYCPFHKLKVVILGQDPYHSSEFIEGKRVPHAHGLSFSTPKKARKIPPSLKNIYQEIFENYKNTGKNYEMPDHGNLSHWAEQGVLLLNSVLTVTPGRAGAHAGKGWEIFTDEVIQKISEEKSGIIFLLWGRYAQEKGRVIDTSKHHILKAAHPSPFSAHNGFFGCDHFARVNAILQEQGVSEIVW
jgi:uracil-DNA glycosylase